MRTINSVRMGRDFTPVFIQSVEQLLVTALGNPVARYNDQIPAFELCLMAAEALPHHALDPIALDRVTDVFLGHRGAETGVMPVVGCREHSDVPITRLDLAASEYAPVTLGFQQAYRSRVTRARATQGNSGSGRQSCTPLRAPRFDDLPAVLGTHARAKPMGALALQIAGLECSLHGAACFRSCLRFGTCISGAKTGRAGYCFWPAAVNR